MLKTEVLDKNKHNRKEFDCGNEELNNYLASGANQSALKAISKTYVLIDDDSPSVIIGYYTLTFAGVDSPPVAPYSSIAKTQPALKLARLAVDNRFKGNRFGEQLLYEIIQKTANTTHSDFPAPVIGLFVDAKPGVAEFYAQYGFRSAEAVDGNKLWLPIQDCVATIRK